MKEYWNDLTASQKTKLILKIVLGVLAMIFAIRNWQSVEVVLVFFKMKIPLTIVIILSGVIGFALASVFDYKKFKKKDREISNLKSKLLPPEEKENK